MLLGFVAEDGVVDRPVEEHGHSVIEFHSLKKVIG
jgi:hypothetical protein